MPFGDRTGPRGLGPMTGRRAGYCSGFQLPGSMNPASGRGRSGFSGRGMGRGWSGRGRGWRNCYLATGIPGWAKGGYGYPPFGTGFKAEDEVDVLKDHAEFLKQQLSGVEKRISTLEKARGQESG
jgi:hypothetical protein